MEAEPLKSEPPKRKRRWFQFSLRSLLIVVTLLAVACGYVGSQAEIVRERKAMLALIRSEGGDTPGFTHYKRPPPVPWLRRVMGDEWIDTIVLARAVDAEKLADIKQTFPDADLYLWDESGSFLQELSKHSARDGRDD
jgi:hypothetical protein